MGFTDEGVAGRTGEEEPVGQREQKHRAVIHEHSHNISYLIFS